MGLDPLIENFTKNLWIKGSYAQNQRPCQLLWMLWFDEKFHQMDLSLKYFFIFLKIYQTCSRGWMLIWSFQSRRYSRLYERQTCQGNHRQGILCGWLLIKFFPFCAYSNYFTLKMFFFMNFLKVFITGFPSNLDWVQQSSFKCNMDKHDLIFVYTGCFFWLVLIMAKSLLKSETWS